MESVVNGSCSALARVSGWVEEWRRSHGKRTKLPEALWGEIVGLAGELGVNRTSHALGLWYYSVKRRLAASQAPAASRAGFVEVGLAEAFPAGAGCVIEMDRADGARVIIREATTEHVAVIASSFLGKRP